MPAKSSTTLKLPRALKTRIARVAKKTGRTPHGFMVEALERQTAREERMEALVDEALASDREIEEGGEVYAADDVHAWLERLVRGEKPAMPKPWRG
jgi:predicted transcriptional regulator